jgi:hypothetical protein
MVPGKIQVTATRAGLEAGQVELEAGAVALTGGLGAAR